MANTEHVAIVRKGTASVSEWRDTHSGTRMDLSGADLRRARLEHADLRGADFSGANLYWADLRWSDLQDCRFSQANLTRADFHKADLENAKLDQADLRYANLEDAELRGVDFAQAKFGNTRLFNVDLSTARGLESCFHDGPSFTDRETFSRIDMLPDVFLKGIGLLSGYPATVIKVVVGSPGDLAAKRDRARESIYEWNDSNSQLRKVVLLPVL